MSKPVKTVIELQNVSKRYGENIVLNNIHFDLREGEVHGLIGENGAGKSTTMKLLAGVYYDYEGKMILNGQHTILRSPAEAQDKGIGMVHQELSVFKQLSVAENIFNRNPPGRLGFVNHKRMNLQAQQYLNELGLDVDVTEVMGNLPVGTQQLIEIARVIFSGANILILDEPTSALSAPETKSLFEFIGRLKDQGKSIIFISHFLEDVLAVTDRISVFKNGTKVKTLETPQTGKHQLVELMIGANTKVLQQLYEGKRHTQQKSVGDALLLVEGLSRKKEFSDVSFSIRSGEILGLFGFMGAGQISLARCLFGAERSDKGRITMNGEEIILKNTTQGRNAGIAYVPENRHDSLMLNQEIYKNISLPHLHKLTGWLLNKKKEVDIAVAQITELMVRPSDPLIRVGTLSGGNQQKIVLAKWLTQLPALLILNEPTRGIDIGAKEEVLTIIKALRDKGVSILLITSEPEMILAIADRALVMSKGRITSTMNGDQLTKQNLMQYA